MFKKNARSGSAIRRIEFFARAFQPLLNGARGYSKISRNFLRGDCAATNSSARVSFCERELVPLDVSIVELIHVPYRPS